MEEKPRTLLLVDDEANVLSALTRLFRSEGYSVIRAGGGQEGLAALSRQAVQVVISDQRMPGMTGVEFLRKVKASYPDTVRIVLSGYTDLQSITDAINEGAIYKFMTKPWNDEELKAVIAEAFVVHEALSNHEQQMQELVHKAEHDAMYMENLIAQAESTDKLNLQLLTMVQEMVELMPVPLLGISSEGEIMLVNRAGSSAFGVSASPGSPASRCLPESVLATMSGDWPTGAGTYVTAPDLEGRLRRFFVARLGRWSHADGYCVLLGETDEWMPKPSNRG